MGSFSHRLVQSWPADLFRNCFRTSEGPVTVCTGPCRLWKRGAKHPLRSSVRRWFCSSFGTPFSALHSSGRNHATRFSMFFSSSKKQWRTFCRFSIAKCFGHIFCIAGAGIEPPTAPAIDVGPTIGSPPSP